MPPFFIIYWGWVSSIASVYARFKGPQGWEYQRVGKGRPPKGAKFRIRFTDAQGRRCWSQPFDTPQQAQENADGVALATRAAAQGLIVAEYQEQTNAGRTPVKVAVERFLKLHRNDRPKTVKQYNLALTHLLANLPRGVRFIKDLATSDALDAYVRTLQAEEYAAKTIETRMGVIFSMLKDNKKETGRFLSFIVFAGGIRGIGDGRAEVLDPSHLQELALRGVRCIAVARPTCALGRYAGDRLRAGVDRRDSVGVRGDEPDEICGDCVSRSFAFCRRSRLGAISEEQGTGAYRNPDL